jgi:hypothetical protein
MGSADEFYAGVFALARVLHAGRPARPSRPKPPPDPAGDALCGTCSRCLVGVERASTGTGNCATGRTPGGAT